MSSLVFYIFQSNTIPDRGTIYDFCFEKKASGQWIDWMDTLDKSLSTLAPDAKVNTSQWNHPKNTSHYSIVLCVKI